MSVKEIALRLLYPPKWLLLLLTFVTATTLTAVFLKELEDTVIAYAVYTISFYTLVTITAFMVKYLPLKYRKAKEKIYKNPISNRYITDKAFKTHISLYFTFAINVLYVLLNVGSYLKYRSYWFAVLALYYVILATMRFLLLSYVRTRKIGSDFVGELKRTKICAVVLLTVNFALTGSVMMILYYDKGYNYGGLLIYPVAVYTFFITVNAIVNLVKYRKSGSPVMTMANVISLSAALVSMLSLETAMLSQFGNDTSLYDKRLMIALTGAGVSIAIISMSVYVIVMSYRKLKR